MCKEAWLGDGIVSKKQFMRKRKGFIEEADVFRGQCGLLLEWPYILLN